MKFLKPLTVIATVIPLALTGCVTDPVTGQQSASKTAMYGLGGAAVCGIVGALTHGGKGARNSALACGAVGAGIGGYMDYQEKKLRQSLANTNIEVERQGNQINGHTDNTGNDAINEPLSRNRAESVATFLQSRGVSSTRLSTFGYGSRQPIASNATVEGRAQNRRVEILINPDQRAIDAAKKQM